MWSLVRGVLVLAVLTCGSAGAKNKLEGYQGILNATSPYSVGKPVEPEKPRQHMRIRDDRARWAAHATNEPIRASWERWCGEVREWEQATDQHQTAEINRLISANGSFAQMLSDLGLRQTISVLSQNRYFSLSHPHLRLKMSDQRTVFAEAVREFASETTNLGSAIEGISAALEGPRDPKVHWRGHYYTEDSEPLLLRPFLIGLLNGKNTFFASPSARTGFLEDFYTAALKLSGSPLRFGQQALLSVKDAGTFLFIVRLEESVLGPKWERTAAETYDHGAVFRRFRDIGATDREWGELLELWPSRQARIALKNNRIGVPGLTRLGAYVRNCVQSILSY